MRKTVASVSLQPDEVHEILDALGCWRDENGSLMQGDWLARVERLIRFFEALDTEGR